MTMAEDESSRVTSVGSFQKDAPDEDRRPSRDQRGWTSRAAEYVATFRAFLTEVAAVAIGGLAIIALPALVAVATASRFGDIQIEVGDLGVRAGRVSTMAWTSQEGGALTVGTAGGFLINVQRDGTPVQPPRAAAQPYAPGPIVEIFPSDTEVAADAVWMSVAGGYAGYRLGTEATYRGLAYRVDGSLKAVSPVAGGGKGRTVPLFDPTIRGMVVGQQNRLVRAGPARLTALASLGSEVGRYVVAGYESGAVAVFRASAETEVGPIEPPDLRSSPTIHAGPVLAIAGQAQSSDPAAQVATAAADGTVAVYHLQAGSDTTAFVRAATFEIWTDGATGGSQSALTGPVPRREGLMFDHFGRVLLLWDQGGGISVARLGSEQPPVFRRYPLTGIPRSEPDRSLRTVQVALRDLGLYGGPLDGIAGPLTMAALSDFRKRAGLEWIQLRDIDRLAGVLLPSIWATSAAALSPRGDLFAVAGADGLVRVVVLPTDPAAEPSAAKTVTLLGHGGLITRIAISPDGRMLASLDATGRLLITDLDRLLGISSLPLAAFSTAPLPEELDPLPVDLAAFLAATAEPAPTVAAPAPTDAAPRRFVVCEGQFESRCKPFHYDIFVGCYQVESTISKVCEGRSSQRVQIRASEPGNRCGYSWYNVSC